MCLKGIQWEVCLKHQNVRQRNPAAVAQEMSGKGVRFLKMKIITAHYRVSESAHANQCDEANLH